MGWYSPNITSNHLAANERHLGSWEAVVQGRERLTWLELAPRVRRLAGAMIRLGIRPGDRIALVLPSGVAFVEANCAAQVAGAIPTPLNYRFTADELARQLSHSGASALVFDPAFAEAVAGARRAVAGPIVATSACPLDGALLLDELLASGEDRDPAVPTAHGDDAALLYTGGTTGAPRGVPLTYGALLEMFASLASSLALRGFALELEDQQLGKLLTALPVPSFLAAAPRAAALLRSGPLRRILDHPAARGSLRAIVHCVLDHPELPRLAPRRATRFFLPSMPFFHVASYQILHASVTMGWITLLALEDPGFDVRRTLALVEKERPFLLANVPTAWRKILDHPDSGSFDLGGVRVAATGASSCPLDLKRRLLERIPGVLVLDMLGQTEMTPVTSFRFDHKPAELKERSVGHAIVEVRVVDERGEDLPRGEVGEIWYRSPSMMRGYFRDERATSEVLRGGWFRSGDLGSLDEDGEVRIHGRLNECINTGGEKVFPGEVEEVIRTHPLVEEVCVFGLPSEEWGETVCAAVQARPGSPPPDLEEIRRHCRPSLAGFKIPRRVAVIERLPVSELGKVLRAAVKTIFERPDAAGLL
jgi:acyl-CoA synthetase (AMP-forming)/AMP-acid ligase II